MVGFKYKQRTRLIKPWVTSFILKNKADAAASRAEVVKITNNVSGATGGETLKHVTDGEVYIKARFSEAAVKQFLAEIEDESQTEWGLSMVILQQYSLEFEPSPVLNASEYVLKVDKFKLWDLQEGFHRKAAEPRFCMENEEVKVKAVEEWKKWRAENQLKDMEENSEASQKDESSSVSLSQLLAEMAHPSFEDSAIQLTAGNADEKTVEQSHRCGTDENTLPDSFLQKLYSPFRPKEFQIFEKDQNDQNKIAVWKPDYRPSQSAESHESTSSQAEYEPASINTLAGVSNREQTQDSQEKNIEADERPLNKAETGNQSQIARFSTNRQSKMSEKHQESQKSEKAGQQSQMSEYSQAGSSVWQKELESVHFSCSSEESSLDFGSPTDHSTQIDGYRKPVTRCRKSLQPIWSANISDNENSSIKYLGIISEPICSQSNDSDGVKGVSKTKIDTVDLITSSDSFREEYETEDNNCSGAQKIAKRSSRTAFRYTNRTQTNKNSTNSSENSEIKYLGIITQAKPDYDMSKQIKPEPDKNIKIEPSVNILATELTRSPGGQVVNETVTSSPSLLKQEKLSPVKTVTPKTDVVIDIVEKVTDNSASEIPSGKQLRRQNSESGYILHRTSFDRQSDLSLTLSSDRSVISPSPEAEVAHVSPLSVVGNMSRFGFTRKNNGINAANQSRSTRENIDDKRILAPLTAHLTKETNDQDSNTSTKKEVTDGSIISKMFHLKSPRKNLEKMLEEIDNKTLNTNIVNKNSNRNETSTQNEFVDCSEASVEVIVKNESGQMTEVADQEIHQCYTTVCSDQNQTEQKFTNILSCNVNRSNPSHCSDQEHDKMSSEATEKIDVHWDIGVEVKNVETNTTRQSCETMSSNDDVHLDNGIEVKNVETNETRQLCETDLLPKYSNNISNKKNTHRSNKANSVKTRNQRRTRLQLLKSGQDKNNNLKGGQKKNNKQADTASSSEAVRKTSSDHKRENVLKTCFVQLERIDSDTISRKSPRTVTKNKSKSNKVGGILRDLMTDEQFGMMSNGSKGDLSVEVLTSQSTSEENNDINANSGLEISELNSSEDLSVREDEECMNRSAFRMKLVPTQTFSSQEILNDDSFACLVDIESTQNTSREEETCDLQNSKSTKSSTPKPLSKWQDHFHTWIKGYKKSGCDASQCSECGDLSFTIDTSNEKTNETDLLDKGISASIFYELRTPHKKRVNAGISDKNTTNEHTVVTSKSHTGKKCAEIKKSSSDSATKNQDNCSEVSSFIELNSEIGRCIRELKNKLQSTKETSSDNLQDNSRTLQDKLSAVKDKSESGQTMSQMICKSIKDNEASEQNVQEQTRIYESQGFDTHDSPDLLTGTPLLDTENRDAEIPSKTLVMPDILTGTQPFDKMSQTQGFVPDLSNSHSCLSNSCNSSLNISDKVRSPDSVSLAKSPTFTLGSGLCNENYGSSNFSSAVADELMSEEVRLQNLCKPEQKKDKNWPVKYKIFKEKGRQKSNSDFQIQAGNKGDDLKDQKAAAANENCSADVNIESENIIISSDSSQDTVKDQERIINEYEQSERKSEGSDTNSVSLTAEPLLILKENETTSEGIPEPLNIDKTRTQCRISGLAHSDSRNFISPQRNNMKVSHKKTLESLTVWKSLDLSFVSVQPIQLDKSKTPNKNILCVKPIRKGNKKSFYSSVKKIDSKSEFKYEVRKDKIRKTYEAKPVIIDGHEMGNKNMWMNIVKSPYPVSSNLTKKRKHDGEEHAQWKEKLVRKEVDGIYRFVREPVCSSSASFATDERVNFEANAESTTVPGVLNVDIHEAPVHMVQSEHTEKTVSNEAKEIPSSLETCLRNGTETISNKLQTVDSNTKYSKSDDVRQDLSNNHEETSSEAEPDRIEKENISEQLKEFSAEKLVIENSESGIKKSNKRKLDNYSDNNDNGTDCKVSRTMSPLETEHKDGDASFSNVPNRQTTMEEFFKDTEKEQRKNKHHEVLDMRNLFTQEWVEKQTFKLHSSSSEESQKLDTPPTAAGTTCVQTDKGAQCLGSEQVIKPDTTAAKTLNAPSSIEKIDKFWSSLSTEKASGIGKKLLSLELPVDLKQEALRVLKE